MRWLLLVPARAGSRTSLCPCPGFTALGSDPRMGAWKGQQRSWVMWPRCPDIAQLVRGTAGLRDRVSGLLVLEHFSPNPLSS